MCTRVWVCVCVLVLVRESGGACTPGNVKLTLSPTHETHDEQQWRRTGTTRTTVPMMTMAMTMMMQIQMPMMKRQPGKILTSRIVIRLRDEKVFDVRSLEYDFHADDDGRKIVATIWI